MSINIDTLTEAELVDLNHRVVERLRFLQSARDHATMLRFSIGDRVTFEPDLRGPIFGVITRYNKKSVSVLTDDGRRWTVAPGFLQPASPKSVKASSTGSVVALRPKPDGKA